MAKAKTLAMRGKSFAKHKKLRIKDFKGATRARPLKYLTNERNVGLAILECLQNNDPAGVMEVIGIYLNALNKAKMREKSSLPKSTLYHSLKNKNPTVKTLAKIVYSYTQEASDAA